MFLTFQNMYKHTDEFYVFLAVTLFAKRSTTVFTGVRLQFLILEQSTGQKGEGIENLVSSSERKYMSSTTYTFR